MSDLAECLIETAASMARHWIRTRPEKIDPKLLEAWYKRHPEDRRADAGAEQ